jgi:minor extracellular serine protease Vpr
MAGPVVSGIVALLLEANPYLSSYQIKEILKESARQDNFTSTIPLDGSLVWGAGKVNAYQAIQKALETIGNVEINEIENKIIQFYPNPTFDFLNIQLDNEINEIQIINSLGEISICKGNQNQFSLNDLRNGTYLIRFNNKGKIVQQKVVKI